MYPLCHPTITMPISSPGSIPRPHSLRLRIWESPVAILAVRTLGNVLIVPSHSYCLLIEALPRDSYAVETVTGQVMKRIWHHQCSQSAVWKHTRQLDFVTSSWDCVWGSSGIRQTWISISESQEMEAGPQREALWWDVVSVATLRDAKESGKQGFRVVPQLAIRPGFHGPLNHYRSPKERSEFGWSSSL